MKKVFGERLRLARGDKTQQELADLLGENQQTYGRWENNKSEPKFEMLHRICVCLGVSADWLLGLGSLGACADPPEAVAEPKMYERLEGCAGCASRDAVIADQAAAIRDLSSAVGGQKKTADSRAPSCSRLATPV